jgi:hypothetical protein
VIVRARTASGALKNQRANLHNGSRKRTPKKIIIALVFKTADALQNASKKLPFLSRKATAEIRRKLLANCLRIGLAA